MKLRVFLSALFSVLVLVCQAQTAQFSLSGKVVDDLGLPLEGAHALLKEQNRIAVTDAAGQFVLDGLEVGTYHVEVSYVGFHLSEMVVEVQPTGKHEPLLFILEPAPIGLDALVVKATRAGEKSPFTYTFVKKDALEVRNLGQDVPVLLQWTPSAVVTSDAGTGIGYTGIRIRGSDPTRINVTVNGIPLNDAESHNVFWVDLPDFASSTQDVQIQRGVGTSTNGAGAFGATISLNTATINSQPYAELNATLGSFGSRKANVNFGTGLLREKFYLDGRFSTIHFDGFIDRASADMHSWFFSGGFLGSANSLRINVFSGREITYQAWYGVPAQYLSDENLLTFNSAGTEKPGDPYPDEVDDYTQTHAQAIYSHQLSHAWDLNAALHYTRGSGFYEQYKAGQNWQRYGLAPQPDTFTTDLVRRRWLDNDFYGATATISYHFGKLEAIAGGAWNRYLGDHFGEIVWAEHMPGLTNNTRYYQGDGDKRDFNFFGKLSFDLSPVVTGFIDLQYRAIQYKMGGTDNDLRDVTNSDALHFFNPKAGIFLEFTPRTKAYASVAVAHREPNRDDYTQATDRTRPRPEQLTNVELGFRQNWKHAGLEFNLFHLKYRDQLVLTGAINDVGAPIRVNVPDSYRAGAELSGAVRLAPWLSIDGNATLSRNKISAFAEHIDDWDTWSQEVVERKNTDLALSPSFVAGQGFTFSALPHHKRMALDISLSTKCVGHQYLDNTSNPLTTLKPYAFSDAGIRLTWRPRFVKEIQLNFSALSLFVWADNMPGQRTLGDFLFGGSRKNAYMTNGWTYRFLSENYDPRPDDPYATAEGNGVYNLTGYFPQAGRQFLLGLKIKI